MDRKRILGGALLGLAALLGFSAAPASAETVIRTAIPAYYDGLLPIYAAIDTGAMAEAGLKLEITTFQGGGAAAQAFASGSIDLCICSFDHVIKLRARNFDAVAIAGVEEFHAYVLMTPSTTPYTTIESLKGHKLGITSAGSATDITLRYEIKSLKLDPNRDYTILPAGSDTAMKAALENGQVDAGMAIAAVAEEMMMTPGKYRTIVDFRNQPYPLLVAMARQAWLKDNAATAKAFGKALVKAEKALQADPELAAATSRKMFPRMDAELASRIGKAAVRRLSKDGGIAEAGVTNLTERQLFAGAIPKAIPYAEAVDLTFVRN